MIITMVQFYIKPVVEHQRKTNENLTFTTLKQNARVQCISPSILFSVNAPINIVLSVLFRNKLKVEQHQVSYFKACLYTL